MFQGFSDKTIDFMWGIRFNNEKAWFEAHKEEYLTYFYNPMRELGRQVVGYYDPKQPDRITEDRPRKPVFGGFLFFVFAVFLLWFGIMTFTGQVSIS